MKRKAWALVWAEEQEDADGVREGDISVLPPEENYRTVVVEKGKERDIWGDVLAIFDTEQNAKDYKTKNNPGSYFKVVEVEISGKKERV